MPEITPPSVALTVLTKDHGPLTKIIDLDPATGRPRSDGSQCEMATGDAQRVSLAWPDEFADYIAALLPNEAIALGSMIPSVPGVASIRTKKHLAQAATSDPAVIARSGDFFEFPAGQAAICLIDFDSKAMPDSVRQHIQALGGVWQALLTVAPMLGHTTRINRASTSAGLSRSDTGEPFPGSDGQHIYVLAADGSAIADFLKTLHERCWMLGLGWWMLGNAGQFLSRSIVDRAVGGPERLVFEANPKLIAPIAQDLAARQPIITLNPLARLAASQRNDLDGPDCLDTHKAAPRLNLVERNTLKGIMLAAKRPLFAESDRLQAAFVGTGVKTLRHRDPSLTDDQAKHIVQRQLAGVLHPDIVLPFDDAALAGKTVADVLANPDAYLACTLADPIEGPAYGGGKAMVMGSAQHLFINSFAHGGRRYELKQDGRSITKMIANAKPEDTAKLLGTHLFNAELTALESHDLTTMAQGKSGMGKRAFGAVMRDMQAQHEAEARDSKKAAATLDEDASRVTLIAPAPDAERTPVMRMIDEVLSNVRAAEPPMRTLQGVPVEVLDRSVAGLHQLTEASGDGEDTRLPPPTMPQIAVHTTLTLEMEIEKHIRFVAEDDEGTMRAVALNQAFVRAYEEYRESNLPKLAAVVTAPVVLPDASLLITPGLNRDRKTVFRVPPQLAAILPHRADCDQNAIAAAMDFLAREWLCDVTCGFDGKCILISYALSIIERTLLPERPVYFVTAGKAGGGKTTAIGMVVLAVTGKNPAATAYSTNQEEMRKALFAYLGAGLPTLVWDNIDLGTQIKSPSIEKACTAETYIDRVLGESEFKEVSALTILTFTGNNIAPMGDLATRSLICNVKVTDADPENRPVKHHDPAGWTLANRGKILRALYTILLGNPALGTPNPVLHTRFKAWFHLVGSAIEHAAERLTNQQHGQGYAHPVDFRALFRNSKAEDEDGESVAAMLKILHGQYGVKPFTANTVAELLNKNLVPDAWMLHELLDAPRETKMKPGSCSSAMVGHRLKRLLGNPTVVQIECGMNAKGEPISAGSEMTLARVSTDASGGNSKQYVIKMKTGMDAEAANPM